MKTRIVDWLLGIVVGIVLLLLLQPKHVNYEDLLKEKDKQYAHKIDSIKYVIDDLKKRDLVWINTVHSLRIEKSLASQRSDLYRKKYEQIKRTPVLLHYTNQQIDSVLAALYPR
jgi:hypothetical protein